jgi:Ala-tRNA(Pro) deacylase
VTIPNTIHEYLNRAGVPYDVMVHKRTGCALANAHTAHIPAAILAKGVLLKYANGYILAAVPASHQVRLEEVGSCLHQPVALASEQEVTELFRDCAPGAIPAIGDAYEINTIVDDRLEGQNDIYFEGGDHYSLIHINGWDFDELTDACLHANIGTRH